MAAVDDWAARLGRLLGIGDSVIVIPSPEGASVELPCAKKHTARFDIGRHLPPDIVVKKMRQKNWGVGKRLYCPDHNPTKRNINRIAREIVQPLKEIVEMAGTAAKPANDAAPSAPTSEQAREARRMAHMMLEEQFDIDKGRFKNGYTDRRIADECGVSEHWVSRRREEEFGPLKSPPEIVEATARLDALEAQIKQFEKEAMLTVDGWRRDLAAHRNLLQGLITKNGWAS